MKILLVGDTSGNPDEGMKRIAHELSDLFSSNPDMKVLFASVPDVLSNRRYFGKVDIIHYIPGPTWRSFILASFLKRVLGCNPKTIISFIHPCWSIAATVFFRTFKPDGVIVQSPEWKNYCLGSDVLISDELLVGVDVERFRPVSGEERARIRNKLGLPLEKKVLLHVGHLNRGRNLLKMTSFKGNRNILPVIVGSTTVQPDGKVVKALREAGVRVVHEYQKTIESFYQCADCYIFPTEDPRFCVQVPLSVLEAFACGIPVISTRFGGLPVFFPEGFPGLIYLDNVNCIPEAVENVLASGIRPDVTRLKKYSWDKVAARLSVFYKKLLGV